jgi:hypothetical protein
MLFALIIHNYFNIEKMIYKIEEAARGFIYHWFVYMVGSLKQIDLSSKIDICFDREDYTEYQKETFDILSDVINVVSNNCEYKLLPSIKPIDATNNSGIDHVDVTTYPFLRELFLSRVNGFDTSKYEKIYIRRNRSHLCEGNMSDNGIKRRQIINEDDLVLELKKIGFNCINFEDYTVSEKVQIFNNAKVVVAPQSGGLVFSLFAGENTKIVEIYPPNPHQYCDQYIDICKNLKIEFTRYCDVTKMDYHDNMIVYPDKLVNYLSNF